MEDRDKEAGAVFGDDTSIYMTDSMHFCAELRLASFLQSIGHG